MLARSLQKENFKIQRSVDSPTHQCFNDYNFNDCIGRGNFGDVYKAYDPKLKKYVAIKAVNLEHSDDEIPVLLQEITLLRTLKHENITNWYKTFVFDVTMFIVMEYCSEGSCADLLKFHKKGLEENLLSYVMKSVLQGLKYLHGSGVIHRDIKAANILITNKSTIKLADFGVSGQLDGGKGRSTFVGTPYWMAPEMVTDSAVLKKDRENMDRRLKECGIGRHTLYKLWRKKLSGEEAGQERERAEAHTIKLGPKLLSFSNDNRIGGFSGSVQDVCVDGSPEIEYTEKVDIWSLGITLIELGTGKVPNGEKEPLKALFEIPNCEPPRVPATSSYHLKEFGLACLFKDPILRPSAEELLQFKFISKNRIRDDDLKVLTGHGSRVKKRRPKHDICFQSIHYGPGVAWDLEEPADMVSQGARCRARVATTATVPGNVDSSTVSQMGSRCSSRSVARENQDPTDQLPTDSSSEGGLNNHAHQGITANTSPLQESRTSREINALANRLCLKYQNNAKVAPLLRNVASSVINLECCDEYAVRELVRRLSLVLD